MVSFVGGDNNADGQVDAGPCFDDADGTFLLFPSWREEPKQGPSFLKAKQYYGP